MKIGGPPTAPASPEDAKAKRLYDSIMEIAHSLDTMDLLAFRACFQQRRSWEQASSAVRDLFRKTIRRL
jgi:hypothetical protein